MDRWVEGIGMDVWMEGRDGSEWMGLGFVVEAKEHTGSLLVPGLVLPAFLCYIFQQKVTHKGS